VLHHVEVQVLVMLLIAALVGVVARHLRLPYTLALVVAGLVLGLLHVEALHGVELNKDLLLLLFLPALLFEAAMHIDPSAFRREAALILVLAVPGVVVATGLTAALVHGGLGALGLAPGFGWPQAFLFAAVICATDPVSVLALFRELGVPRRLYLLVEGESLLNDGVAVVVFLIVGAVVGLGDGPPLEGAGEIAVYGVRTFVWMAGGGVLIGAGVGGGVSLLMRHIDDHLVEVTLTALVAYGSFLLAEQIHASGVLATVVAGMVTGSVGRQYGMSPSTRIAVEDFWEYAAFIANSLVFLLVGLELQPGDLADNALAIAIAFLAVLLARAVVVYTGVPIGARFVEPMPTAWRHVLVWGGLRGSLSMVLILALPVAFPGRTLLVSLVFGVVAASLFLQGLTIGPLLSRLGLRIGPGGRRDYEVARLQTLVARDALSALDRLSHHLAPHVARQLREVYRERLDRAEARAVACAGEDVVDEQLIEGMQELVRIEQETIRHAAAAGLVAQDVAAELEADLIVRREALAKAHHGEVGAALPLLDSLRPPPDPPPTEESASKS
jgi:monovalent cation:H+ antiporter, CPA1 family